MNESDRRTRRLVQEQTEKDIANFDPHKEVEHLPHDESGLVFEQIDNRIRYKRENEYYYARRFFPSEECARQVMELLNKKGV